MTPNNLKIYARISAINAEIEYMKALNARKELYKEEPIFVSEFHSLYQEISMLCDQIDQDNDCQSNNN